MTNEHGAVCGAIELTADGPVSCGDDAPDHALTVEQVSLEGITQQRLPVCERHYRALKAELFHDVPDGTPVEARSRLVDSGGNGA